MNESETTNNSGIVKAQPAGPEKESWYMFRLKEEQETPIRLEDAAKFLSSMIAVSLTIFLSVTGKDGSVSVSVTKMLLVLVPWILSLLTSFFVLFPFRYKYSKDSIKTFQDAHKKIVKTKRTLLIFSLGFYFLALVILGTIFLF
jgi:hypothetical protein